MAEPYEIVSALHTFLRKAMILRYLGLALWICSDRHSLQLNCGLGGGAEEEKPPTSFTI